MIMYLLQVCTGEAFEPIYKSLGHRELGVTEGKKTENQVFPQYDTEIHNLEFCTIFSKSACQTCPEPMEKTYIQCLFIWHNFPFHHSFYNISVIGLWEHFVKFVNVMWGFNMSQNDVESPFYNIQLGNCPNYEEQIHGNSSKTA